MYFGSHSRVSQGRAASAFVVSLLVWIGPLSRTATRGRVAFGGAVGSAKLVEQGNEVGGALGGAGMDEQVPMHRKREAARILRELRANG